MTSFDDREKGFERKYAHDEELIFKANALRNKMLGLWAAEKLGKTGEDAGQYAKDVILVDFEGEGNNDVVGKLLKDFNNANVSITEEEINAEMDRLLPIARDN
ncbi:MAG: DUF1476 domain-containing protein, partial [Rickettsiales bacterium]